MTPGIRHHVMHATYGWRHAAPRQQQPRWQGWVIAFIFGVIVGAIDYGI